MEKKVGILIRDFGLDSSDFFVDRKSNRETELVIIRKTGIIKIQQKINAKVNLMSMEAIPYGNKAMVLAMVEAFVIGDPESRIVMEGEANPDNSTNAFSYFGATAKKRAESRAILALADLTKYDMHGEIEADEFKTAGRGVKALDQTMKKAEEVYGKDKS